MVDTIYNGCTTYGSTPSSKTPSAIVNSIKTIYTDRYNAGYQVGVSDGSASGMKHYRTSCLGKDVKNFSNNTAILYQIICGFTPSIVLIYNNSRISFMVYNKNNLSDSMVCVYSNQNPKRYKINDSSTSYKLYIDDNGIRFSCMFCYKEDTFYIDLFK